MSQMAMASTLKLIIAGNSDTGKTSFSNKWIKSIFIETYKPTVVGEFGLKIFEKDGKLYRIQLWDVAGKDKNYMVTKIYAKDAHGCIYMLDVTNKQGREE